MLEGFPFLLIFVTDLLNMATVLSYGNSTDDFLKGPERMTGILLDRLASRELKNIYPQSLTFCIL